VEFYIEIVIEKKYGSGLVKRMKSVMQVVNILYIFLNFIKNI